MFSHKKNTSVAYIENKNASKRFADNQGKVYKHCIYDKSNVFS